MKKVIVVLLIVVASAGSVFADSNVWKGNTDPSDNYWTTAANWQYGLPVTDTTAFITYDWTDGVNGPIIADCNAAVADTIYLGIGGWGEEGGVTTMYMTGGTLDVRNFWIGKDDEQNDPNTPGVLEISDGVLTSTGNLIISCGSDGTVNQTGGSVIANTFALDWQTTSLPEYGYYNLHGGTLDIATMHFRPHGRMDIEEGVMTVAGDIDSSITNLINSGQLTGYGGTGAVLHDYNTTTPGKTTVWASTDAPPGGGIWKGNLDPCDNLWMTGSNWQLGNPPTSTDNAHITEDWTDGINGPIVQAGDDAVAHDVYIGKGNSGAGDTTMYMTGGTLDVAHNIWLGKDDGQSYPEAPGIFDITSGDVTIAGYLIISSGCDGTVNQDGGSVITNNLVLNWFTIPESGSEYGYYNLHGGTLDVTTLHFRDRAHMDIEEGVMTIQGNVTLSIANLANSGHITAYAGAKYVRCDYDITNTGKTTVWASDTPPPGGGVWKGNTDPLDNSWTTPGNWQLGNPPTSADNATITYSWTDGINGPIIADCNAAVADEVYIGLGNWGEGTTTMYMTGGTLDVASNIWLGKDDGQNPEVPGVFDISGGDITIVGSLIIGSGSDGTINQTGGSVTAYDVVMNWLEISDPAYGYYNLHGGTLNIGHGLYIRDNCSMDITEGVMIIEGDMSASIAGVVLSGQLTAYGGAGYVRYDYDITNAGKTTVWGSTTQPDGFKIIADDGWNIYTQTGLGYRYGPSFIVNSDGSIDRWSSSPEGPGADSVAYNRSTDGGLTWTDDITALAPTEGSLDDFSTCDPGVIKFGGYYYIGYTSSYIWYPPPQGDGDPGTDNEVFVARSTSPDGGGDYPNSYEKWNGTGWGGGDPQPIVRYTGTPGAFGAGEPSFVVKDDVLYMYYAWIDGGTYTRLATADATDPCWPAALIFHGDVISKPGGSDSSDVKYVDSVGKFIAVNTAARMGPNSYVKVWTSSDGFTFTESGWTYDKMEPYCHNMGISGDETGHINDNEQHFIAYAYGPLWGWWSTKLHPVTICDTDYAMDFDCSCTVTLTDFANFASEWAELGPNIMDFDKSGSVDIADLAAFAQHWLDDTRVP